MSSDIATKPSTDRRGQIDGSDARLILGVDEAALIRLSREKRGEAEPEDLSENLPATDYLRWQVMIEFERLLNAFLKGDLIKLELTRHERIRRFRNPGLVGYHPSVALADTTHTPLRGGISQ
jgi:hypothetical protein